MLGSALNSVRSDLHHFTRSAMKLIDIKENVGGFGPLMAGLRN